MGAWIETNAPPTVSILVLSHPVWVRGLKPLVLTLLKCSKRSHPVWVRGLKQIENQYKGQKMQSHPVWVRGLKLI